MSPLLQPASSSSNRNFDETRWVISIRQSLELDIEEGYDIPACIFSVPKPLISTNPDSYTPQQVAIGPYHCLRQELYELERCKLMAARKMQKKFEKQKIHNLVEKLKQIEPMIRACYNKYLEFNSETLAWMMAIDAAFLVEFLQIYGAKVGENLTRGCLRKSEHNEILRDIVMLENQIPLLVLRELVGCQISSMESADCVLISMLVGLCRELSPLELTENFSKGQVSKYSHVLDFIYQTIVPKIEERSKIEIEEEEEKLDAQEKERTNDSNSFRRFLNEIKLFIKKVFSSKPARFIAILPWKILSNLPGFTVLKVSIEYMFYSQENETRQGDASLGTRENVDKPPLVEEITIPSVSDLYESGVSFIPINGNISSISFDFKSGQFYLPIVSLDNNTEVVLRNLVAYEASNTSRPLVFTRYTELMNGIIDSEEDVRLLREQGIVLNRLKSDREAADLWNGMSKSVRLTKVPFLDKVIEDVNRYYAGRWRVKIGSLVKRYVYGSWQLLAFLAAALILLLLSLQVFSLVCNSMRLFRMRSARSQ